MSNWLNRFRDRVVVRSLIGKRKLDAAFLRRDLDRKLYRLGEQFLSLARDGRVAVPPEVAVLLAEARDLEERLEAQHADIAALESEAA